MALGSKKREALWIWIAYDRKRGRPISFECGSREDATGLKLWEKIKTIECQWYTSDHWASYDRFLPPWKHISGKRFTHVTESFNATVRHYLARFHRRTHC